MNRKHSIFLKAVISACLIILLGGCSTTMKLHYAKPTAATLDRGEIYVIVHDLRLPDRGGNDPTRVGTIRNSFGMPFPLQASPDREPSLVIKELVTDCLQASRYKVSAQPTEGTPQLHVELKAFWGDGYQHSRIGTTIPMELKKSKNAEPSWQHTFTINIGVTWTVGYGPFNRGINSMLEKLKDKIVTEFDSPDFLKSMKS